MLREWPSTYELLPRYRAVRDEESSSEHYPHELGSASFTKRALTAWGMHQEIETAWGALDPAQRPEVLALFARGHVTPSRAVLHGGRVRVTKADAEWQPNVGDRFADEHVVADQLRGQLLGMRQEAHAFSRVFSR
jgi:hypothetical protein